MTYRGLAAALLLFAAGCPKSGGAPASGGSDAGSSDAGGAKACGGNAHGAVLENALSHVDADSRVMGAVVVTNGKIHHVAIVGKDGGATGALHFLEYDGRCGLLGFRETVFADELLDGPIDRKRPAPLGLPFAPVWAAKTDGQVLLRGGE